MKWSRLHAKCHLLHIQHQHIPCLSLDYSLQKNPKKPYKSYDFSPAFFTLGDDRTTYGLYSGLDIMVWLFSQSLYDAPGDQIIVFFYGCGEVNIIFIAAVRK